MTTITQQINKIALTISAALTALAFAAPAAHADSDIMSLCRTTTTGWEIWVDDSDAACGYARDAYRQTRRKQRQRGGLQPGDRFRLHMGAGIVMRCRAIAYTDGSYSIKCRERYHGIVVQFDHP